MLTSKTTTRSQTKGARVPSPLQLALAASSRKRSPPSPPRSPARSKSPTANAGLKTSQDPSSEDSPPNEAKQAPVTPARPSEKKKTDTVKNRTPAAIRHIKAAEEEETLLTPSDLQDAEAPGAGEPTSPLRGKALAAGFLAMTDEANPNVRRRSEQTRRRDERSQETQRPVGWRRR